MRLLLRLPLAFLGAGRFEARIYRDAPRGIAIEKRTASAADTLDARLGEAGGPLVRLSPGP